MQADIKPAYVRENFSITAFDAEDVITTSGMLPVDPTSPDAIALEKDNVHYTFGDFSQSPGSWF